MGVSGFLRALAQVALMLPHVQACARHLAQTLAKRVHPSQVGLPLTWHVADANVAKFLRKIFEKEGWNNITVHPTPPAR